MRCSSCGTSNPANFKFCGECGSPLALSCPTCGAALAPGLKFCGQCGAPARQAAADPAAAPPQAERRLVTVMFADLVGFTSASQARDPEEVRELLSRYFDTCRRLVELYGGTLEKFIGDAVMAVWGAPTANEDDAERAVRTALDLVKAVQALGEEVHIPELQARAGVLSGEAAVTVGAVGQGMVAGDLVNTASRVQALAPPGSVLVGEATRRLSEASIVYEDFGVHEVKGKDDPVHVFSATQVVAARGGAQRSTALEPPFVGRERELRLLKELFHATADESRAHLVSVTGIAGIGKSRLAWEFFKYIDGLAGQIRWHAGRCLAYGDGVTYWALAEMVRTRAGIVEGEGGEVALAKLRKAIEESVPDTEERKWIEPRLALLIGQVESAMGDRQDIFAAWRRFYERLAEQMPTVMVFEDMQWADPSLVDFIDYLLDWSRDHRLFIVTLGRAGEAQGGSARGHTAVHLEPLARGAMETLITSLVPGLPEELVTRILERAEGVPLYAVETIRMLLDRGLLTQEGSAYRPTGPIESLEVPDSLHTLIAARLDGLDTDERHLLQQAAVMGKTFTTAGLTAVSRRVAPEVESVLTGLLRKEVLTVRADPRSPERGQYGFLQDLVRQIAYETLSRRDRKELHLRVAAYLEQTLGADQDEVAEVLASHYLDAYREAPDAADAPAVKDRARKALARAGERASALAAAEEAQAYYDQAAELADSPLEKADLFDRAGLMAMRRTLIEQAVSRYDAATAIYETHGDQRGAARVAAHLAEVQVGQGNLMSAAERLKPAYDVMAGGEPDEALGVIAAELGRMLTLMERAEEGRPYLEKALAIAEALLLPELFSQALNTKGIALMSAGRHQEAGLLIRHSLDVAVQNGLWTAAFRAFNNLGVEYYFTDQNRQGLTLFNEAFEHARRIGDRRQAAVALSSKLGYMHALGLWDEELQTARECEAMAGQQLMQTSWLVNRFVVCLQVLCERGQVGEARQWADRLSPWMATDQPDVALANDALMATVLRAEGRPAEALALLRESLRVHGAVNLNGPGGKLAWPLAVESAFAVSDLGAVEVILAPVLSMRPGEMPPALLGQGLRFKARLAAAKGETAGVEQAFRSAVGTFREGEMAFLQAATEVEMAEWLVGQGRAAAAAEPLAEAAVIFERLKATPWLERVRKAGAATVPA